MQPTTSYWPPTRSPATSFGVNENGRPQLLQKPSVRPGLPSRERPTCSSQLAQNRFDSGTLGSVRTASSGSGRGTGSISTRPAPSRWRCEVVLVVPVRCRVTVAVGSEGDDAELDALPAPVPPVWPVIEARLIPVTLQYPSSISPGQPGSGHFTSAPFAPWSRRGVPRGTAARARRPRRGRSAR